MTKQLQYTETYKVHTYEIDTNQRLTLPALASLIQDVASSHAEILGFGYSQLSAQNLFWALSRIYIEFEKMPKWNEEFAITTWHKGYNGVLALRDFEVKDLDGKVLAKATSSWLVVDIANRRVKRSEQVCGSEGVFFENAIDKTLNKLEFTGENLQKVAEIIPKFSHVDMNKHVNNVNYYTWLLDYAPVDLTKEILKSVEINFLLESKLGNTIEIEYLNNNNEWHCIMKDKENGVVHSSSVIILKN
ncbi:acyl-ACP thioesterase [Bacteroidia bacterium]|nr:acyl-ACP thioesterase [Bacteroidia bacterium]